MKDLPDSLPPKWRENMHERRACLLRFRPERQMSTKAARAVALALIASEGHGEWECAVVRLDTRGRDWELRFKPHVARPPRTRLHTIPS